MDYQNQSLDQMVKRDKKLGRVRGQGQPRPNQRGTQAPLPGRNRGGANNVQRARQQPRMQQTTNAISKRKQQRPQQQNQQKNNAQGTLSKRQRQNQRRRLMGDQPMQNQQMQNQGGQGGQQRRQTLQNLRQNKRTRGRRAQTGNQNLPRTAVNQQPPLRKRMPQGPAAPMAQPKQKMAQNQQNTQQQKLSRTLSVVQGTLAERKLRVRGIDSRVVSQADLQKLFSKCGPLINASFDTNEFGSYLGTATVIYSRASSANRAIKEYNMAKIDQRPMKVQFAIQPAAQQQPQKQAQAQSPRQQPVQQMPARRRTDARIGKSGQGKTLNVMGQKRQGRGQRGSRQ